MITNAIKCLIIYIVNPKVLLFILSGVATMENSHPPELTTIWDEAKAYIDRGNYDKAIETYKYILIMYPDEKTAIEYANAYLGDIYLTLQKPEVAEEYIKKAIGLNPQNPVYRCQLGFAYSGQRYWKEAIREFQAALKHEPNNSEYIRGLGWAVYHVGDKAKGLEYLLKANKLEPNNVNIINDLSVAYLGIFDLKSAVKYSNQALKIDPGNSLAKSIRDQIQDLKKHWPEKMN
jgi:tetratricopeptide (TPR) repeat protein